MGVLDLNKYFKIEKKLFKFITPSLECMYEDTTNIFNTIKTHRKMYQDLSKL